MIVICCWEVEYNSFILDYDQIFHCGVQRVLNSHFKGAYQLKKDREEPSLIEISCMDKVNRVKCSLPTFRQPQAQSLNNNLNTQSLEEINT